MARRARRPAAARVPEIVNDKEPEKNREDVSQRLLPDVIGKRIEAPLRKDDKITLKPTNPQSLSDSENEEPFSGRSFYKSAFVSKSNINSLTSLSWSINSKIERSQSCNDTLNERCTRGRKATQLPKSKVSVSALGRAEQNLPFLWIF
ncbi:E3 ubiquitin- ligase RNF169 [Pelobates cultripes]|uniref:E3 ubiquitin- ligase RNF169 n=1 Tax=Pelobates cultripes TaxID=61616 RepID=A0AAD1SDV6_PELCU|nr:E3 ubiquitin- ligase RNF169 [Pelobates cultripes]